MPTHSFPFNDSTGWAIYEALGWSLQSIALVHTRNDMALSVQNTRVYEPLQTNTNTRTHTRISTSVRHPWSIITRLTRAGSLGLLSRVGENNKRLPTQTRPNHFPVYDPVCSLKDPLAPWSLFWEREGGLFFGEVLSMYKLWEWAANKRTRCVDCLSDTKRLFSNPLECRMIRETKRHH